MLEFKSAEDLSKLSPDDPVFPIVADFVKCLITDYIAEGYEYIPEDDITNQHNPCRQFLLNLLHARFVTGFQSVTASLGWSDVIFVRVAFSTCFTANQLFLHSCSLRLPAT